MRRTTLAAALLIAIASLAGCGDDDSGTATEPTAAPTTEATAPAPEGEPGEATTTTDGPAPMTPTEETAPPPNTEPPATSPGEGTAPPPNTETPVTNPPGSEAAESELTLYIDAFADQGPIPVVFTCDGANAVPDIAWDRYPPGTTSLALTVIDPDGGDWIHWVAWNIPPGAGALPPETPTGDLPDGTRQGANDFAQVFAAGELFPGGGEVRIDGWDGPCPPPGGPHRYVFTLYALTGTIDLPSGTPGAEILAAIEAARQDGSLIGEHTITGLYPPG